MKPHYHLLYGMFAVIPIGRIFGLIPSLLFLFATIFIDIDHYIYYVAVKKNFSLTKAYNFHIGRTHSDPWRGMFFHAIESILLISMISCFIPYFLFIFLGMVFHLSLDFISNNKVSILGWIK